MTFTQSKFKPAIFALAGLAIIAFSFKNAERKSADKLFTYEGKTYKPGDTVFGFKNYTKLVVGDDDAPLLLGVPHDGVNIGSPEIPETGTTGRDINTLPLAFEIAMNFKSTTKKRAWIVINTIGRKRVDPNTFPNEVDKRYTNEDAKSTYLSYHSLLAAARERMAEAQKNGKGGLFLDLHGQAHSYQTAQPYISVKGNELSSKFIDQTELGYGLSGHAISQGDEYLDKLADSSSIAAIAKANPSVPFSQLIRGPHSFGGLLEAEGVIAVPGTRIKTLEVSEELFGIDAKGNAKKRPYFNGGYCTRKYGTAVLGSTKGYQDNISSIQAETPGITVRNNEAIREIAGERFNKAIVNYLNKWYGYTYKVR
ncbi:hypothetical protein [Pedobacter xixiisoli]|uniref:N-formylglutamate amidohydrolase n=1 Tax=Pedobacter xixiisoli TaxID=1476464 RepID=A0A285ZXL8_9SPHI|nr:hypothetical protein [Pedobacter xixiisoli]SOD14403.1 hypothetical protein SAMN06297358_1557 [Pedobacter xixiisoli]